MVEREPLNETSALDKLFELKLPTGSYMVMGSGILDALGIRRANDIDLVVSDELYKELKTAGWSDRTASNGATGLEHGVFQAYNHWLDETTVKTLDELLVDAEWVGEVPYNSLDKLIFYKTRRGNEKDLADLRLIEEYLNPPIYSPEYEWGKRPDRDATKEAHDIMMMLGSITVRFSDIKRAPRFPDGRQENDVEHSYHLATSAVELATRYYPDLNPGLVVQFSLVHDLPEIYAGDVRSFGASDEALKNKKEAEARATERLLDELPPYLADLLEKYEKQEQPEAKFVRLVDKLLPAVMNTLAGEANTFTEDYGIDSAEGVLAGRADRTKRLKKMFPEEEWEFIFQLRELVSKSSLKALFPDD